MGMPEYAEFLDIYQHWPQMRLDTTMVFTPFVEETMPFPRSQQHRLRDMRDRIVFGSDFPNIPYDYMEALRSITRLPGVDDYWLRAVFYGNAARLFTSPDAVGEPGLPSAW